MADTNNIIIEDNEINEADFMSKDFISKEVKNRAFINVLGAELLIKYLNSNDIDAEDTYDFHSISKFLEYVDIADIQLNNIFLDTRVVFDEAKMFVPKKHFELGLTPDIYVFIKPDKDFKNGEVLGYIKPERIDKNKENSDYYFVDSEELSDASGLIEFIKGYSKAPDEELTEEEFLKARELYISMSDHDINDNDVKKLFAYAKKNESLRSSILEFDNFEILSYNVIREINEDISTQEESVNNTNPQDNGSSITDLAEDLPILEEVPSEINFENLEETENSELNLEFFEEEQSDSEKQNDEQEEPQNSSEDESNSNQDVELTEFDTPQELELDTEQDFDANMEDLFNGEDMLEEENNLTEEADENPHHTDISKIADIASKAAEAITESSIVETIVPTAAATQEAMKLAGYAGNSKIEDLNKVADASLKSIDSIAQIQTEDFTDNIAGIDQGLEFEGLPDLGEEDYTLDMDNIDIPEVKDETPNTTELIDLPFNDNSDSSSNLENITGTDIPELEDISETEEVLNTDLQEFEDSFEENKEENPEIMEDSLEDLPELEPADIESMQEEDSFFGEEILTAEPDTIEQQDTPQESDENNNEPDFSDFEIAEDEEFAEPDSEISKPEESDSIQENTQNNEQEKDNEEDIENNVSEYEHDSKNLIENSVVITDKTITPGEIPIDINNTVEMDIPEAEQLEDLYNKSEDMPKGFIQGTGIGTHNNTKGMGIIGLAVIIAIIAIIGFAASKIIKSKNEAPEPVTPAVTEESTPVVPESNTENINQDNVVNMENTAPAAPSKGVNTPAAKKDNKTQVSSTVPARAVKPLSATTYIDIKKVSWEIPDYVSANQEFRQYFQAAGKSLKLSLMSDLLLATEGIYSDTAKVTVTYDKDGNFKDAKMLLSTGSQKVDKIVLQTVNQSLKVLKAPASVANNDSTIVILKLYF